MEDDAVRIFTPKNTQRLHRYTTCGVRPAPALPGPGLDSTLGTFYIDHNKKTCLHSLVSRMRLSRLLSHFAGMAASSSSTPMSQICQRFSSLRRSCHLMAPPGRKSIMGSAESLARNKARTMQKFAVVHSKKRQLAFRQPTAICVYERNMQTIAMHVMFPSLAITHNQFYIPSSHPSKQSDPSARSCSCSC